MSRLAISVLIILVGAISAVAQNQGNVWYFGTQAGLDFNTTPPTVLTDGANNGGLACGSITAEGTASISDADGNLLFYTDGTRVWDKTHNVMPNGYALIGGISSTQSSMIIPQPNHHGKYFVFTTDDFCNDLQNGLRYSIVDLCLNNGLGDVLEGEKNVLLLDSVGEKLTATTHANGVDYWVLTHKYWSDAFYAFLVTETGISDTVISRIGTVHEPLNGATEYFTAIGQLKFSPDGSKVAAIAGNGAMLLDLFDFNNVTGVLSNHIDLASSISMTLAYGVSFSPNNQRLYTSTQAVHQFDLTSNPNNIAQSAIEISDGDSWVQYRSLQLGPDGKVYVSRGSEYLAVIDNPNALGLGCNYLDSAINLGSGNCEYGLTNFIDSYDYAATGICDTGVGVNYVEAEVSIQAYPNPTANQLNINLPSNKKATAVGMLDMLGREVLHQPYTTQINVSHLPAGNYVLAVYTEVGVLRKRIVIE